MANIYNKDRSSIRNWRSSNKSLPFLTHTNWKRFWHLSQAKISIIST